jgi:hypothetical protein
MGGDLTGPKGLYFQNMEQDETLGSDFLFRKFNCNSLVLWAKATYIFYQMHGGAAPNNALKIKTIVPFSLPLQ